jgi:hypothetical protein
LPILATLGLLLPKIIAGGFRVATKVAPLISNVHTYNSIQKKNKSMGLFKGRGKGIFGGFLKSKMGGLISKIQNRPGKGRLKKWVSDRANQSIREMGTKGSNPIHKARQMAENLKKEVQSTAIQAIGGTGIPPVPGTEPGTSPGLSLSEMLKNPDKKKVLIVTVVIGLATAIYFMNRKKRR